MNRDMERHKEFSRRAMMLGTGKILLFGTLALRLAYLEVAEHSKYETLSNENSVGIRLLPAQRGVIIDRFGAPMAVNKPDFRAVLVPEQTDDLEDTIDGFARLIPLSDEEKEDIMVAVRRHRRFAPVLVKENLSWKDMAKVEVNLPHLAGVSVEQGEMRSYPLGRNAAHVIGYVGRVNKAEMTNDPAMSLPGFRIGKTGIEKEYDKVLRGTVGEVQDEVNSVGREIRELKRTEGTPGKRLTLTLDSDLQMQCHQFITKHRSAAVVAMDVHNGEIYALASHPSFDPNVFSAGIPADLWEGLLSDPADPLTDKATAGQYPPGSTFKIVTALAGLESGKINAATHINCPGYYKLGNSIFHCWKRGGHGNIGVVQAIRESCDVFFYETAQRVGIEALAKMAHRMGLGQRLNFDLPDVARGLIPTKAWKQKRYNRRWEKGETLIAAIGQGYVLATPLQLATMAARVANGGLAVMPTLLREIGDEEKTPSAPPSIGLDPAHLALVRKGMEQVVNNPHGTAYNVRITTPPYSMAGKTGTAQVRRTTAKMRAEGIDVFHMPWKFRDHALFVGYGPVHKPAYAAAAIVEHGIEGALSAAPVVRDVLLAAMKRDPRLIRTIDEAESAHVHKNRKDGGEDGL